MIDSVSLPSLQRHRAPVCFNPLSGSDLNKGIMVVLDSGEQVITSDCNMLNTFAARCVRFGNHVLLQGGFRVHIPGGRAVILSQLLD